MLQEVSSAPKKARNWQPQQNGKMKQLASRETQKKLFLLDGVMVTDLQVGAGPIRSHTRILYPAFHNSYMQVSARHTWQD